jgi:mercuric ion transport protein
MSTDRRKIAGWLGRVGGAGIAMLICCTTTAAAAGGGFAAAGGVLRSPWLIAGGLVVVAMAVAALIVQRIGRHDASGDECCPPTRFDPRQTAPKETSQR